MGVAEPGTRVLGKFRVERELGRGGMGVVVLAHHEQLDERVAIKFLERRSQDADEAEARFLREARSAVKLKSEHVARVSDVGRLDDGTPYMVMEYLDGTDLAEFIRRRGRIPADEAVDLVLQACVALAEAHSLGIVHRDIKPSNCFLTRRSDGTPLVKLLDFGLSKGTAGTDMRLTSSSAFLGTPLYMSPEQMRSTREVDHRTDIWSLGALLYELVAGRPPFESPNLMELCVQVATDRAPALPSDLPPALTRAVMRCLEKAPARRFAHVGELAAALAPVSTSSHAGLLVERCAGILRWQSPPPASAEPATVRGGGPAPSATGTTLGSSVGELRAVRAGSKRWRGLIVAAIGVLVAGTAAVVVLAIVGGPPVEAPAPAVAPAAAAPPDRPAPAPAPAAAAPAVEPAAGAAALEADAAPSPAEIAAEAPAADAAPVVAAPRRKRAARGRPRGTAPAPESKRRPTEEELLHSRQ